MPATRVWSESTAFKNVSPRSNPLLAVLGDSISAQGFGGTLAGGYTFASVGYATWLPFLTRHRVDLTPNSNHGIAGETSAQALARLSNVITLNPGVCVVLCGTNDIGTLTPAQTKTNLNAIYAGLEAAGITIIAVLITPRGSITTAQQGHIQQVNRWILDQRSVRQRFHTVNANLTYGDPLTGAPRTTMSADALHPIVYGAYTIAEAIRPIIERLYPNAILPFTNVLDVYSATDNPTGNLMAGTVGLTAGTAGTKSNGPTGDLATSWSANGVNLPAGSTVVFSKVAKADGREFQQVTFGGTYNAASPSSFNITAPSVHASVAAGDTIELMCEIEADAGLLNLATVQLVLDIATPAGNPVPIDFVANNSHMLPPVAFAGTMRTPRVTLPGTPTLVRPTIRFTPAGVGVSSTLAGTVRFGSVSVRKV